MIAAIKGAPGSLTNDSSTVPSVRYYVHGAGRSGEQAWLAQAAETAVFADHGSVRSAAEKAAMVGQQAPAGPYAVVAHSLGAVISLLAMRGHNLSPSHLVLVEPALYDVARGKAAIEAHIEPMTRARDRAKKGDLFGYWQIVKPMMFGQTATSDAWTEDQEIAARFASLEAPWGHQIDPAFARSVPTLVLTGGWNDEYEAIATVLAQAGASTVVLTGKDHRVQDHPDFHATVEAFLASNRW